MIAHPIGETRNYTIGLSARLSPTDAVSVVNTVVVKPAGGLSVQSYSVSGDGLGVLLSGVSGGDFGEYYTVSISATSAHGKPLSSSLTIAVAGVEVLARAPTVLDVIRQARERIRDNRTGSLDIPSGYKYTWEYDDSNLLVSNSTLVGYLNDARNEYAKRVPILDSSSALTEIEVKTGANRYPYDPRILAIRGVWYGADSIPLRKTTEARMDLRHPAWRTAPVPYTNGGTCAPEGREGFYVENAEQKFIMLGFVPTEDSVLRLHTERLPFEKCSWENRWDVLLEPDQQYIDALLWWMEHRVYSTQDSELFNKDRGMTGRQMFELAVGPTVSARELAAKRAMANMTINTMPKIKRYY